MSKSNVTFIATAMISFVLIYIERTSVFTIAWNSLPIALAVLIVFFSESIIPELGFVLSGAVKYIFIFGGLVWCASQVFGTMSDEQYSNLEELSKRNSTFKKEFNMIQDSSKLTPLQYHQLYNKYTGPLV